MKLVSIIVTENEIRELDSTCRDIIIGQFIVTCISVSGVRIYLDYVHSFIGKVVLTKNKDLKERVNVILELVVTTSTIIRL